MDFGNMEIWMSLVFEWSVRNGSAPYQMLQTCEILYQEMPFERCLRSSTSNPNEFSSTRRRRRSGLCTLTRSWKDLSA
ncbi:hypothetical protein IMY05_001G0236800 [Salix suchowensis]|nr:hypothetical protein IMY05_001G0236800 [Salix suchowensis]